MTSPTSEYVRCDPHPSVTLLTGGHDRSYALGLTESLVTRGIAVDFIGSDAVDAPELHRSRLINFINLRGDQTTTAPFYQKVLRIVRFYIRLVRYSVTAKPRIFHILWNNKFQFVDTVVLMLLYRALGKRVMLTAHNVNAAKRDGQDSVYNRLTLKFQYTLCDHIFVHTSRMKCELETEFGVPSAKVEVIPFGINNTTPRTGITRQESRSRLGVADSGKLLLLFGQIAPYKGVEYIVEAMRQLTTSGECIYLVIAGKIKAGHEAYWQKIKAALDGEPLRSRVIQHVRFIPDCDVEIYIKSADAVVLPYVSIFQSGVPFLAYSFGLPVIATDVGCLREDIIEGQTGFVTKPCDSAALAGAIMRYFSSEMYHRLEQTRTFIQEHANKRHSWDNVSAITYAAYQNTRFTGTHQNIVPLTTHTGYRAQNTTIDDST